MYTNKAIVYGNLTRDPEMKALPSGQQVTNFSIATNRTWKDANGTKQESVDYHNIVMFGKTAEIANQYLKKGSGVYVEGRMQTRSWDDATGKKYKTEIVGETMQFGPKTVEAVKADPTQGEVAEPLVDTKTSKGYNGEVIDTEDIPF